MKKYRNKILQGVVIALGIFIILIVLADAGSLLDALREFPLWLLLPIVLLKIVNVTFRYLEWHYLLGVIGVRTVVHGETAPASGSQPATIRLRDNIVVYLSGFPMSLSPGKAAELLKSAIVKNLTGVPITRTAPVVMTERIVDGLAVLLIIAAAGLIGGDAVFKDVKNVDAGYIQGVLIFTVVAMVVGIGLIQMKWLALRVLDLLRHVPLIRRFQPALVQLYESSFELLKLRRLLLTTGFGLVAYGTDCIAFFMMLRGMGVRGEGMLLAQASFILGFAVIVAALSAMPAGAGARELSVSVLIVGIIGADTATAEAVTLINTFFQVGLVVMVGAAVAVIFRRVLFPPELNAVLAEADYHDPPPVFAATGD